MKLEYRIYAIISRYKNKKKRVLRYLNDIFHYLWFH